MIVTGNFSKALWPGVNAWYGREYDEFPVQYTELFDTHKSTRAYEEDVSLSGFGLARRKPESQAIDYDTESQGFVTRYQHYVYALGFKVSKEIMEDDLYDIVAPRNAKALAFSMRQTKEILAANVYNRADNGAYVGGDGVSLLNAAHPNYAGGTQSNMLAIPADLSEAALEQAVIDLSRITNDRGLRISIKPEKLILPVDLQFEAERILKSEYRVSTGNNDKNALKSMGMFRSVVVNNYLEDPDAWFIRTNVKDGMKYWERRAMTFAIDNDFDTDVAKFKASERYSFGWSDWRQLFGSLGA